MSSLRYVFSALAAPAALAASATALAQMPSPVPASGTAFNPATSASLVVLGGGTDRRRAATADDLTSGVDLQEAELRLSANADPYLRAEVRLAGNREEIGFEEAYLATLAIPWVTVRAGHMLATFGRHNLLHTHAYPFLTAPLPWRALLGPEGLRDPGVSADVLLPLPFFAELNAQVFGGDFEWLQGGLRDDASTEVDESALDRRRPEDLAYGGHLRTLLELDLSTTLELGASYLGGRNGLGGWSSLVGADVTFKWRPIEAERYRSVELSAEYLWLERRRRVPDQRQGGGYAAVRYQFAQRWWVQARGAVLGTPAVAGERTYRGEALAAFVPSELSAIRLQYALQTPARSFAPAHELFLQAIVAIGAHPAHDY